MEVAGLVIGTVALLALAEKFEAVQRLLHTFRNDVKIVDAFVLGLEAERAKFKNACYLLSDILDRLEASQHWATDVDRRDTLIDILGTNYQVLADILIQIEEILVEITKDAELIRALLSRVSGRPIPKLLFELESFVGNNSSNSGQSWYRKTRLERKIKATFGRNRRDGDLIELSQWTEKFRTIISQIDDIRDIFQGNIFQIDPPPRIHWKLLRRIKLSQGASKRLYEILSCKWCCKDHIYHIASLDLEDKGRDVDSNVEFILCFTCWQTTGVRPSSPLWLKIDSKQNDGYMEAMREEPHVPNAMEGLQNQLARTPLFQRTPRVTFHQPEPAPTSATTMQEDLDLTGNLCAYIHQTHTDAADGQCLGRLAKTNLNPFQYSLHRIQTPSDNLSDTRSLNELLREGKSLDWTQKFKLARTLALSVLRFHSTKWLPRLWRSNDIYFFESTENCLIGSPHLRPRLHDETATVENYLHSIPELFSLGIVLLELFYDRALDDISQLSQGFSMNDVQTLFEARRLSRDASLGFNMIYRNVVQKCLDCHFSGGPSLEERELQTRVLVEVVKKLDLCLNQRNAVTEEAPPFGL